MLTQSIAYRRTLPALAVACALAAFTVQPAAAQTAGNLKCNGCVNSKDIKNNGIKSTDIKNGQVKNADLGSNAVTGDKIADGEVGAADLTSNAVTSDKIADGAIGTSELGSEVVSGDKIAADAVDSAKVQNDSLLAGDLGDEAGADFIDGNQEVDLSSTDTVVRAVSISAPRAGVVIVNAQLYADFNNTDGSMRCVITTGTTVDTTRHVVLSGGSGTAHRFHAVALTRGFDVNAGSTTFNLVCDATSTNTDATDSSMTAIYVPTKY